MPISEILDRIWVAVEEKKLAKSIKQLAIPRSSDN